MTKIRRGKINSHFTILSNEVLRDSRLSYKARGLLAYMLSFSEDWIFYKKKLIDDSNRDGRDSVNTGLKELINYGYLIKEQKRNSDGRFDTNEWVLCETPQTDYPLTENPSTDNQHLRINKYKKNKFKKEEEDIYKYKEIHDKIIALAEKNTENARKILQVFQYLKNANVGTKDINEIIEFLYGNIQYLNARCIIAQHKACVVQSKTDEGLFDYAKFFINGLQIRYQNQLLENKETTVQFNNAFGITELPTITMYNWLKGVYI
ncbi:helix-turn-helix domain-containing protein [Enterococcus cecorum]|uniref:Helix-turn-helix domain-containing protein n=1 Tax=Enterococcus cecorum TaxID=44008 RepID=A0AAW8TST9_9ENTE|nr:helix-turn-helix domain-containing protein [Enterococcus cecorum]MDT2797581.1 helix-turn-helix domain-containing protein [Enterococcus cecorum]